MRLTCDAKPLINDLKKFSEENKRKLKVMIASAARDLASVAVENTPIAPADLIDTKYFYISTYQQRADKYGIDPTQGFHAGAWVYSDSPDVALDPNHYAPESIAGTVFSTANQEYRLGETFYILAKGPAFAGIERGYSPQAPDGIMQPTIDEIINIYKVNLVSYYQRG